jgi:LysM repeat protein
MRPRLIVLTVCLALVGAATLAACGGSGTGKNAAQTLKELHDPKLAPTASLSGTPAAPLPASVAAAAAGGVGSATTPDTYVVKSGDTLGSIAVALGVTVDDIVSANPGVDPAALKIGQQLKVPKPGASAPLPAPGGAVGGVPPLGTVGPGATVLPGAQVPPTGGAPTGGSSGSVPPTSGSTQVVAPSVAASSATQYTVKSGDTACGIAIQFGVGLQELADANGLSKDQIARLSIGQLLKIPPRSGKRDC